jgi:A/G-specific adenine glycosylase
MRDLDAVLRAWYARAARPLPWRRDRDPYRVLVAEVMLQQTTVRAVIPYYRRFLRRFPTLRSLARARAAEVLALWSGLGYYRRARHLHAAARAVAGRHGGRLPRRFDDLLALPGVGRYTAGAVASIAFGEARPILDGNVARVLSRLFLVRGLPGAATRTRRLWHLAGRLVAVSPDPGGLNQALMDLGATVCAPGRPDCGACPVAGGCAARAAGLQARIPPPKPRPAPVARRATVLLAERGGRYLMRRREGAGLLAGLWEFPTLGLGDAGSGHDAAGLAPGRLIARLRHTITHRRYAVEVRAARLVARPRRGARFVDPARIAALPVSSLVGKVLIVAPRVWTGRGVGRCRREASAAQTARTRV